MSTIVSLPTWTKLMKQYRSFMRKRPWQMIEAQQVFGFLDPRTNKRYFCSVLGNAKMVTGFYIFPQEEALMQYFYMTLNDQVDVALRQHMIAFMIGSQDALFDEEYDFYEEQAYHFAKGKYFIFRYYEKGYAGTTINEEQAEVLLLAYEVLKKYLKQLESDEELQLYLKNGMDIMKLPFFVKQSDQAWHYHFEDVKQYHQPYVQYHLGKEIEFGDKQLVGTWEIGIFYLPTAVPSMYEHRFVYPKVMIIADIEENQILSIITLKENESDEVLFTSLLVFINHSEYIPQTIFTRGRDANALLKDFEEHSEIEIIENSSSESILDHIWSGFVKFRKNDHELMS